MTTGAGTAASANTRWFPEFDLERFDLTGPSGSTRRTLGVPIDLAQDIGGRDWWIGTASIVALCTLALTAGTLVPPLPMPARAPYTTAQITETRADAIAPLALGGTTGRSTAPGPLVEKLAEAPERPRVETSVRIGGDESLGRAIRRGGASGEDAAIVGNLLGAAAANIKPGTPVDLVLGRRESRSVPRPLQSLSVRAAFDLRVEVNRDSTGGLIVQRIPIAVDNTPMRISGVVGGSLSRAARAAGVPARVVSDYIQAMSYVLDFQRQVGARDRFDIVVEHRRAATGESETGGLLYAGLDRKSDEPIDLLRWTFAGKTQFFRANGESAKKGLMRTPVDGAHLTSNFGMRFHPILNYSRLHQGVDFGAAPGSPVMAAAGGKVTFAGPHGGHGNYIQVTHRPGLITAYAHLSGFAVHAGQQVGQGQVIGYVGSTGLSTGPHLHYEVWLNNEPVNPLAIKFLGGTQLGGTDLSRFKSEMAHIKALHPAGTMSDDDDKPLPAAAPPSTVRVAPGTKVAALAAVPAARARDSAKSEPAPHKGKAAKPSKAGKSAKSTKAKAEPAKLKTGKAGKAKPAKAEPKAGKSKASTKAKPASKSKPEPKAKTASKSKSKAAKPTTAKTPKAKTAKPGH